jgi:hypothetical protein
MFYQRMLAGDPTEATEKAEEFLKERSLSSYYDEVAIKGLQLAQADLDCDALDQSRLVKIHDIKSSNLPMIFLSRPIENRRVSDQRPTRRGRGRRRRTGLRRFTEIAEAHRAIALPFGGKIVLCIAGRTALDEAAAIIFAQLCNVHGLRTRAEGPEALSTNNIFRLETEGVALVCLSYLNAANPAQIRYAVRRLRRKLPRARIMVELWSGADAAERAVTILESSKADLAASTLRDATRFAIEAARLEPEGPCNAKTATTDI